MEKIILSPEKQLWWTWGGNSSCKKKTSMARVEWLWEKAEDEIREETWD